MQAVVLEGIGGPEQLVLRELPPPTPEDGQVVIEVKAVAINFLEILIRRGLYPQMPELPWIPGTEVAGVTGDGRRVIGLVRSSGGGYAEQATVDEQWLFDLPDGASFEEGAAFLMAYLTAWIPLTRQVVIHPGARVLVHAAAGGVGSAAVVVARDLGAEVVATAGSADKLALPLSLGASAGGHLRPARPRSSRSTSSSTRSAASCSPTRSSSCGRSAPRSRSASPAGSGSRSIRRSSSGATSAFRASTWAG